MLESLRQGVRIPRRTVDPKCGRKGPLQIKVKGPGLSAPSTGIAFDEASVGMSDIMSVNNEETG